MGDAIAQHSTKSSRQRYDYVRTLRMSGFGLLFAGPLQGHYWFQYLDKVGLQASRTCREGVHGLRSVQSAVPGQSKPVY